MRSRLKDSMNEELLWSLAGTGAAVLGAVSMRAAARSSWRLIRRSEPPLDVHDPETGWRNAVAWAAVTGMMAGVAGLVARRAASGWNRAFGRLPPS